MLDLCGFGLTYFLYWIQDHRLGSFLRRRMAIQADLNSVASDHRKIQELSVELSNVEDIEMLFSSV